uniref:Periostin n=1 Tax=Scleropages formosus TaxID=113540 RepID=A0A8C9RBR8_SCLFO
MELLVVSLSVLLTLTTPDWVDASAYDKIVSHSRIRAKDKGPNVCALQQVMGTKKKYFSTCRNWYHGSICGKKATVLYECCPGYMKLDGMPGCPAVAPIDHIYGTLGLLKATTTQQYADMSKLKKEIEGSGSYTMFAPSNEAWDLLDRVVRNALVSNVNIELYNALHYHMVNRRLVTKDLKNGLKVTSMYNDLGLHINHYSNGVVTVNCARIIHANQVATNGVVHIIDRVISSVSSTIKDAIEVNDDLSSLNAVAVTSGLLEKLGEPGHFTLFAPTNDAFKKVDRDVLERLMDNKVVLQALMNFHILNSVQCSEAIMAGSSYETLEGHNIEIGCDGESLTINGVKMVLKKDIVTTNGVIHLIDQVLMPDSAKQVVELIGKSQSTFGDMISELGLAAAMRPELEYTLLAPFNGAFTDEVMTMDERLLKVILENHILKMKVTLDQLYDGQMLETVGGKFLRVFVYRTAVCIENACMVRGSKEGSNGALHLMQTLIRPAETTIYEILKADGRFNVFLSLMEAAELTDLLRKEGSYTLFAPTDDAFEGLSDEDIALLKSDLGTLRTILLYHFSNRTFINGGLEGGVTNLLKSILGKNLQVLSVNNSILVNSINVPDNDLMASNGVIHTIKTLLYPGDLPVGREDLLMLLKRLIRYIQIKVMDPVLNFCEALMRVTFCSFTPTVCTNLIITEVIEGEPTIAKVTRVIEGEPSITKVTRVIEGEPSITKVTQVIEGEPSITKVTRVIEGEPSITKVTRVIEGEPSITKRVIEGEPNIIKMTSPQYTITSTSSDGELEVDSEIKKILQEDVSNVKKILEGNVHILQEEEIKRITEGGTGYTKVTRVIHGEPHIIEGPDFSKIASISENPDLIKAESERITHIIQGGMKRKTRLVRRHKKPRQ